MEIVSKWESSKIKLKTDYKEIRKLMNKCRDDLTYKIKQIASKMIGYSVTTESIQSQILKVKTFDLPSHKKLE